jgi:large subunit ribosomal protein L21
LQHVSKHGVHHVCGHKNRRQAVSRRAGEKLKIEQIPADVGAEITLDQVLMVGDGESVKIGAPLVQGASVKAKVLAQGRHDKVKIFKMRRRKHYQKHQGHRQNYTESRFRGISA